MPGSSALQKARLVIIGCQGLDLKKLTPYFGYLDSLALLVYMSFIGYFYFVTLPEAERKGDEENLTMADFTVEVDCLPPAIEDQGKYQQYLKEHLEQRMTDLRKKDESRLWKNVSNTNKPAVAVKELVLVRDYSKRLSSVKDRLKLLEAKEIADYKGDKKGAEKLKKNIRKVSKSLHNVLRPEDDLPVVRAFAVVNTEYDVMNLLILYRFADAFCGMFRCCQSRRNRFQGRAIRLRRPSEPTDILWENQDVPQKERWARQSVMFFIWLIAVLVAGALIYLTTFGARTQTGGTDVARSALGSSDCDAAASSSTGYVCNYQVASLWTTARAKTNLTSDEIKCFCQTKGYTAVLQDSVLTDEVCKDWLVSAGTRAALTLVASLITVVLNSVFQVIIRMFAAWERPLSVSELHSSEMVKVFGSQFLNTALIIYFLNLNFWIFSGDFKDFERGWYSIVGGAMLTTLLLNAFAGSASYVAFAFLATFQRFFCRKRAKHQAELLAMYTNPPFDMSSRYATLLMTVFATLLYSAGLPLVTGFAAGFCLITYWTDKVVLLRFSQRPPFYNSDMPRQAARIMLFGGFFHLFFAIYMYSHRCTFPSDPLGGSLASVSNAALSSATNAATSGGISANTTLTTSVTERLTLESTWTLFVILLILIVAFAIWLTLLLVGATLGEAWRFMVMACCPRRGTKVAPSTSQGNEHQFDKVCSFIENTMPPASYKLERNPEFEPLVKYLREEIPDDDEAADDEEGASRCCSCCGKK